MTATRTLTVFLALAVLGACDNDPPPSDSGMRADSSADTSVSDAGADRCRADDMNAISTLGCNGAPYGSTVQANQIGGGCTPDGADPPGAGTCVAAAGTRAICFPDETMPTMGECVYVCPASSSYVTTGGCPTGSRCFQLTDVAICFRDCTHRRGLFRWRDV